MNAKHALVFDVGAHRGEDSDFYLKLGYKVVAVEANPELVAHLKQRFAREIDRGTYILVDKAIGDSDGEISFFVNEQLSVWGTTDPNWALRNRRLGAESTEVRVQCVRFIDLLRRHGCPHYLKIDIEGADMLCVNALALTECRPTYVSIESNKTSWRELLKEFDALESLGYRKFKVVDQLAHKNGHFKSSLDSQITYSFEDGASGPFGDDLDGEWLTRSQAIRKYIPIFALYKTIGDHAPLSRVAGLLRRIPLLRRAIPRVSWYDTHAMRS